MKTHIRFFLLVILNFTTIQCTNIAITYEKWGGRLGDHILYVGKCLMLCDKYNIPFYYKPFADSDKFQLHTISTHLTPELEATFTKKIKIYHEFQINKIIKNPEEDNILILIQFRTITYNNLLPYSRLNGNFNNYIKKIFTPLEIPSINLLNDIITVAVHVRKGSGIDGPLHSKQNYQTKTTKLRKRTQPSYISDRKYPGKFPPDQFYIDAIKKLSEKLNNPPLYVYIFTDFSNPNAIVEKYKELVNLPNIIWAERDQESNYKDTLIYDLYYMSKFDCLIKPDSNFSSAAQLLGEPKIILFPISPHWVGNSLRIKKIGMTKYGEIVKNI